MSVRQRGTLPKQANGGDKIPERVQDRKTDYSRWRLVDDRGRLTWEYLDSTERAKQWPQTTADKYHLGLDTVRGGLTRLWLCTCSNPY